MLALIVTNLRRRKARTTLTVLPLSLDHVRHDDVGAALGCAGLNY